ncbi:hypothetical protein DUNSADRAFT_798 [Dunaliella salina]|uniref:Uncharacterized protein n=1 Tax=Dunaliella salina TaxID=3046 RepID=A0ABQ7FYB3_DUNSA|nr:hypothetical protein DUNSADRAFT_798 [Dunaliella salina]|eukprot:KAF5827356.1 hypothetical protein DUNSADRAFT_798 [Dunaliella salina]
MLVTELLMLVCCAVGLSATGVGRVGSKASSGAEMGAGSLQQSAHQPAQQEQQQQQQQQPVLNPQQKLALLLQQHPQLEQHLQQNPQMLMQLQQNPQVLQQLVHLTQIKKQQQQQQQQQLLQQQQQGQQPPLPLWGGPRGAGTVNVPAPRGGQALYGQLLGKQATQTPQEEEAASITAGLPQQGMQAHELQHLAPQPRMQGAAAVSGACVLWS